MVFAVADRPAGLGEGCKAGRHGILLFFQLRQHGTADQGPGRLWVQQQFLGLLCSDDRCRIHRHRHANERDKGIQQSAWNRVTCRHRHRGLRHLPLSGTVTLTVGGREFGRGRLVSDPNRLKTILFFDMGATTDVSGDPLDHGGRLGYIAFQVHKGHGVPLN